MDPWLDVTDCRSATGLRASSEASSTRRPPDLPWGPGGLSVVLSGQRDTSSSVAGRVFKSQAVIGA
ncbi:hypothetical protein EYF80_032617 [Liparis tanakae]|uniref:Uncharacterized protein n=1 Tax=Liparis tanakae TaxID=230148 RepID=A0A4Z2GUA1_9TELE|nr:hypothetical protein EYF80_032617 [Liparis tanakae]